MEQFLLIIMYILTGVGALIVFSFWISDIHLDEKRFIWYYYLPAAAVLALLGGIVPHIFVWWLYVLSEGGYAAIMIPILYLLVIIGCLTGGYLPFHNKDDFSKPFYFSLSVYSLIMASFWLSRFVY